jgi:hypothetical protein
MGDKITDGGKTEIQRSQGALSGHDDADGLARPGSKSEVDGAESVGIYGADSKGPNPRLRSRPGTHGKTLSFLIQSLADQIRDSQETQAREAARQARLQQQLEQLQSALEGWHAWLSDVADVGEDAPNV